MSSDLCFDPAFVTLCVLQVFISQAVFKQKAKNKIHGLPGLPFKAEIILSREESSPAVQKSCAGRIKK